MVETIANESINLLKRIGIFNIIIPFILGFSISFGMLEKTKIFGENMKNINILISLMIALLTMLFFN